MRPFRLLDEKQSQIVHGRRAGTCKILDHRNKYPSMHHGIVSSRCDSVANAFAPTCRHARNYTGRSIKRGTVR